MEQGPASVTTRPLRVGLTGGIASGKSAVARYFARHGIPVIDADAIAREIVEPGSDVLTELIAEIGQSFLTPSGELDRPALREAAFSDSALRSRIASVLHPHILTELEARSAAAGGNYQLLVIPLLSETGMETAVDRVLVVDCPVEYQLRRLEGRDSMDESRAQRIIAAQATREERLRIADDVLVNDGSLGKLDSEVARLHARYLELAANRNCPPRPAG